jgi:hypothetical protein
MDAWPCMLEANCWTIVWTCNLWTWQSYPIKLFVLFIMEPHELLLPWHLSPQCVHCCLG